MKVKFLFTNLLLALVLFCKISASAQNPDSLQQVLKSTDADSLKIDVLIDLVNLYQNIDIEQALPFARKAIKIAIANRLDKRLGNSYIAAGRTFANIGVKDSAEYYFTNALEVFEQIGDSLGIANVYGKFVFIEVYQNSNFDRALDYAMKALKLHEGLDNIKGMVASYNDIGTIFYQQNEPEQSNQWTEKALELAEENNFTEEVSLALSTIAYNLIRLENYSLAHSYFDQMIKLAQDNNDVPNLAIAYNGKASVHKLQGEYASAISTYKRSMVAAEESSFLSLLPSLHHNIGQVYYFMGNYQEALTGMQKGLQMAIEYGQDSNLIESYEYIAKAKEALQDYAGALESYKQYSVIKDSVFSAEKELVINELSTKYQTEQKEKEIELLASRNKAQKAQTRLAIFGGLGVLFLAGFLYYRFRYVSKIKEELAASNTTKNRLFSIISHDLRGVVSGFQNVGEIIQFHLSKKNYDRLEQISLRASQSANQLNSLLDNLLQWSIAQMEGIELHPETVSISDEAHEIVELFKENAAAKNIDLATEISPELKAFADANSIKLVLRNLISNALKFSTSGDQITIKGQHENQHIRIEIEDTGTGIPHEKLKTIFRIDQKTSSKGTAGEQGTGLGLALCKEFVERNKGSIELSSEVGIGTKCIFLLPATKTA